MSYAIGESGWSDELAAFHHETSGDDHYIERASRTHTLTQLKRWLNVERPVIVDIGCSSGLILRSLREWFPEAAIVGVDYVSDFLGVLAQDLNDIPLVQFDLTRCPLPDESVDAIVLLNVLEHIEQDRAALAHVERILKPNGIAVIEVPAGERLYDIYDQTFLHCRRYSMVGLLDKVTSAGLQVLEKSHLGCFLYPPFWAIKRRNRRYLKRSPKAQKEIVSRAIVTGRSNLLLHGVMRLEARLRKWAYYPFGIRCLVTCRRTRTGSL